MFYRIIGILLLLSALAAGWFWQGYRHFVSTPLAIPEQGLVFEVPTGSNLRRISRELEALGVLDKPRYLAWYGRHSGQANQIKAGEFRLEPGLTPPALLSLLTSGKTVSYKLTLLEGWNIRQVREAVAGHPVLVQSLAEVSDEDLMARLGRAGEHPEGRFFPDTYQFPRGTTDLEFLQRAYQRMEEVLASAWPDRMQGLPLSDAYQALILASVIEKETGVPEERPAIAGVFVRRLEKGMKLQTDPTVIYGIGEDFDGNLRRRDLVNDTPYNTYTRKGLPPTPICMPGEEAIRAALNPADGDALYFVSRGDGSHQFSATLEQHNAAVRKYQLKRK